MKKNTINVKTKDIVIKISIGSMNFCIPEKINDRIISYKIIIRKDRTSELKNMVYDVLDIIYDEKENPIILGKEFIKIFKKLEENHIVKEIINLGLTDEMKELEKKLKISREMFDYMSSGYYHLFMSFLNRRINNNPMY